ncbi:MAG: PAS domain-containing protein [Drouetiella hepatica Uher 2000/2452]|jgi:signal transduction histidine kinase|uniref:histidine kinase n=1 Tax=Drouetiella hepatica Uher 2000/2452 TaxID=904376 RepID=A0A951Q7B4_9CYAN|nr:PAS domain-containing protein [Drouetiella hepatica Uher 2000/2452]
MLSSFQDESPNLEETPRVKGLETCESNVAAMTTSAQHLILDSFFAAASAVSAGLCIYDAQLRFVRINKALAEIYGLPVEAYPGKTMQEVIPEFSTALEPICRRVLDRGEPIANVEVHGESKSQPGIARYWMTSCFPVPLPQGQGVGVIALDNTARKQVEEALRMQQSRLYQEIQRLNDDLESEVEARTAQLQLAFEFEATLKRITDRVRDSLDEDLILQAAVRELATVIGVSGCNASLYDIEQGTSTICYEYTHSMSPYQGRVSKFSTVPELYDQILKGQYFQFCTLVPNPERGLVATLTCPMRDDQGVIGDLWLINHKDYCFSDQDIRLVEQVANQCAIAIRQARLYEASQSQVKELEYLNQLKDDFLSTVSHELRTPLSNMKMAIHMLRNAPPSARRDRYMEILEAECTRETELINDLLDLQRLENDCYTIAFETIDLPTWLPNMVAPFRSRAQNRQQTLELNLPEHIATVVSDRKSLERILAELLNNACKYTAPGGAIALRVESNLDNRGGLVISQPTITFKVSNQAQVPDTELLRMFEKFYRIPKSDPWQQGGTGLGLALIKKLVETLRGDIEASSGKGWTTLTVELPTLAKVD